MSYLTRYGFEVKVFILWQLQLLTVLFLYFQLFIIPVRTYRYPDRLSKDIIEPLKKKKRVWDFNWPRTIPGRSYFIRIESFWITYILVSYIRGRVYKFFIKTFYKTRTIPDLEVFFFIVFCCKLRLRCSTSQRVGLTISRLLFINLFLNKQ